MSRKRYAPKNTLDTIDQDEESQLYTLICVGSAIMLKKFVQKYGDDGRRMLMEVKYRLSNCPLTYLMIRDMVKKVENWEIKNNGFGGIRYYFEDKLNGTSFTLYNHSAGVSRTISYAGESKVLPKFTPERIKLYFNGEHELFNANERTIVAKVLATHDDMLKNHQELIRQQKLIRSVDKLGKLY